jgi:hypothetical protein
MLELITIPGGLDSNAYVSLEEAEDYMSTLAFKEAWEKADDDQKTAAIIQAARWMDTLSWNGLRGSQEQFMAWPRKGAAVDGAEMPENAIPRRVKEANAEFAFRLLSKDRAGDAEKGISVKGINLPDEERELVPQSVKDLLGCLLKSNNSIRLVRS